LVVIMNSLRLSDWPGDVPQSPGVTGAKQTHPAVQQS
jgi:hypothetical protein